MSIESQVSRIKTNIRNAYTALQNYGVDTPSTATSDDMANQINQIQITKYYLGTSTPSSSIGNDGDIYIQL